MSLDRVGIENIGNTCYLSSIVQCMRHSAIVRSLDPDGGKVADALRRLFSEKKAMSPRRLIAALSQNSQRIDYTVQNDAHEFFVELLDALESECQPISIPLRGDVRQTRMQKLISAMSQHWDETVRSKNCRMTDTFFGQNTFLTQCSLCKHISHSSDVFTALELSLTEGPQKKRLGYDDECIDGFECPNCMKRSPSRRECKMSRAPHVLVVHVMRFASGMRKDLDPIRLQETLDVSDVSLTTQTGHYKLVSVVCHRGHSQRGGHYYALCKLADDTWALFDDESVGPASLEDIRLEDPYMMFYERSR